VPDDGMGVKRNNFFKMFLEQEAAKSNEREHRQRRMQSEAIKSVA
jgi:hypothetical protein